MSGLRNTLRVVTTGGVILAVVLALLTGRALAESVDERPGSAWVLVAHGGAGDYSKAAPEVVEARKVALAAALRKGGAILEGGGRSLDAVVAAIQVLEDSGAFDAGKGSYYSEDGVPELDASLMDGSTLAAGAVASVRRVANPIELARLVMQRTRHVLLVGSGAEEFARSQGMELVSPYYFFNEREWARWRKAREAARGGAREADPARERGTVGVVALDRAGHLAAGTSTGGTVMKMPGRVGDSPIIGAGTYADDRLAAVSATGHGESIIQVTLARHVADLVGAGRTPADAAAEGIRVLGARASGSGGVIVVGPGGEPGFAFNTPAMARAWSDASGAIRAAVS